MSARCPLAMGEDLLRDLTEYKNYKNRAVVAASRSLIQLFRNVNPELLHKKDRVRVMSVNEYKNKAEVAALTTLIQ